MPLCDGGAGVYSVDARNGHPGVLMSQRAQAPMFTMGCQRSGTTRLRLLRDVHPKFSCAPETRIQADLAGVGMRTVTVGPLIASPADPSLRETGYL